MLPPDVTFPDAYSLGFVRSQEASGRLDLYMYRMSRTNIRRFPRHIPIAPAPKRLVLGHLPREVASKYLVSVSNPKRSRLA